MKKLFIFILLFSTINSFSQYYKIYDWEEKPQLHELTESENNESSIAILKKNIVEFGKSKITDKMRIFETTHTIIRVNDDKGINTHNQVYIPMRRVKKLKYIKARTVAKDGKITKKPVNTIFV